MNDTPTTISEGWLKREGAADVLDTIANLSNDEVFTPPRLANQVLDLLPAHVWSDPKVKFLDPCVKTGVFLREIVKRLMVGLAEEFPDVEKRRDHILRNQVYGIAITELTALMSRRTVYCASDATRERNPDFPENCFSAVKFSDAEGNIVFPEAHHDWPHEKNGTVKETAKCRICGASRKDFGGSEREGMETYAYPFIHMDIQEVFGDMQFDVIIGNPPYQIADGGYGASASPIYQKFVEAAKKLEPKYLSMIIPARWYAGGKGLDEFRNEMLNDQGMAILVDIPDASEAFPGVEIKGGVCYFLREPGLLKGCEVRSMKRGEVLSSMNRLLNEHDVLIRHNEAVSILKKVLSKTVSFIEDQVSSRKPFGFPTNFTEFRYSHFDGAVKIYARDQVGWIDSTKILVNREWIAKYKVITSRAYGAGETFPHQITGQPIIAEPESCCTETYLVARVSETQKEAEAFASYMKTRFFRFMVSTRKNTQDINRERFRFVPEMDMSRIWTDADLYAHFGLDQHEIDFIESMIKEMP